MKRLKPVMAETMDSESNDIIIYGRFLLKNKDNKMDDLLYLVQCEYVEPGTQKYWCRRIRFISENQYIEHLKRIEK